MLANVEQQKILYKKPPREIYLFSILIFLLGFSFHFSMAATNGLFYLFALISACYAAFHVRQNSLKSLAIIYQSPLWIVITAWIILLYLSIIYSNASLDLWQDYATKYVKYTLILGMAYTVWFFYAQRIDLPKCFFMGFAVGGGLVFLLAVSNQAFGWLTALANQGYLQPKYVKNDYWISSEPFAQSLFFSILYAYGLLTYLTSQKKIALLICGIALFEVFIASEQRTGYITIFLVTVWFGWIFIESFNHKIIVLLTFFVTIAIILLFENTVSARVFLALHEAQKCFQYFNTHAESLQELGKLCYGSTGQRMIFYLDSLSQISQSWLFGHGLANLDIAYLTHDGDHYQLTKASNPHNEYLLQGIQLGIIGVTLLISIFVLALRVALQIPRQRRYLYASIILMYAVSCLFNSFLLDAFQGLFFVVIISFILAESIQPIAKTQAE